jgi:pilus assembly protein CpaE
MPVGQSVAATDTSRVVLITPDPDFEASVRGTFGGAKIGLDVLQGPLSAHQDLDAAGAALIIADLEAGDDLELEALRRLSAHMAGRMPIIAVAQSFEPGTARLLMQMRVADFLQKPVPPVELARTCARVAKPEQDANNNAEAQIFTFLPAVGGAGVTTLAVQTALLLLNSSGRSKTATCLVDLNFQHGACADYLDIEPRLNLNEIEPRPERLDRQLLQIMLSHHSSGLAVVAAPNRPTEMRSFDPDLVIRLLDLVSAHFECVVFDMPRTWFSWTDSVLLGSDRLFIVSEATVPGLRQAKQLVEAIRERLGEASKPQVIINRFVQNLFSPGLRKGDILQAIGDAFLTSVPNDYALVREAIDRGVPLEEIKKSNKITAQLRQFVLPLASGKAGKEPEGAARRFNLSWARV